MLALVCVSAVCVCCVSVLCVMRRCEMDHHRRCRWSIVRLLPVEYCTVSVQRLRKPCLLSSVSCLVPTTANAIDAGCFRSSRPILRVNR